MAKRSRDEPRNRKITIGATMPALLASIAAGPIAPAAAESAAREHRLLQSPA
jgi:hypothetical protein